MIDYIKSVARKVLGQAPTVLVARAKPLQQVEYNAQRYGQRYNAKHPHSVFVQIAAKEIAETAASVPLRVVERSTGQVVAHPLDNLLGKYGKPNDADSATEFLEGLFSDMVLHGNVYICWVGQGAPTEAYLLDPTRVRVVPDAYRRVGKYVYTQYGQEVDIPPEFITHWRRRAGDNLVGKAALDDMMYELASDEAMARWNYLTFKQGGIPSGVLTVPPETSDEDIERIHAEFSARYSGSPDIAIIRTGDGSANYRAFQKGRELDYIQSRQLHRQIAYELLGLPLGYLSESSTEAHARVAERRFMGVIHRYHERIATKLTVDALPFWPNYDKLAVAIEDVRKAVEDQQQHKLQVETLLMTHSIDEVRAKLYGLDPMEEVDANESTTETGV